MDISLLKNLGLGRGYKPNACFFVAMVKIET